MNREKKIKLFLGSAYILIVFVFLMIFFNNFSFQDFSSYELIRQNREALDNIKNSNRLNISFVAKKKIGNAVTRNKIKRRLRNIMNEAVKSININFNYCYLLIARISVSKDPYETIKNATLEDFKKIK